MDENEKINALDKLFSSSAKYKKSVEFRKLIEFINKFPYLSPFNAFLLHMQNSSATIALTPERWENYNRRVKYQSKPFIILVPFGPVEFVYNISDTEPFDGASEEVPENLMNPFLTLEVNLTHLFFIEPM